MEMPYQIRNAYRDEWEDAMSLAWRTFLRFEADVYSPEGVRNFENFITDSTLYRMFVVGSYQVQASRVTVNSSPYGVEFYHKLGFRDLRPQEKRDGIIYTPMEFVL